MSMLTEKRDELVKKINDLLIERNNKIELKVDAYRKQLQAEPYSNEVIEAQKVLEAIDKVINYEASINVAKADIEKTPIVEQPIEQATIETRVAEPVVERVINEQPVVENVEPVAEAVAPVAETIVEPVQEIAQPQVQQTVEARPGMTVIEIPERR